MSKAEKELKELQQKINELEKDILDNPEDAVFLKRTLGVLLRRLIPLEDDVEKEKLQKKEEPPPTKVSVNKIQIDGKLYFKSKDNILYDSDTKEEVGLWNPKTKTIEELPDEDEDEEEEEPPIKISVGKIQIKGKMYLKSNDNILYDFDTKEEVGLWNPETKTIEELPDEDEDEDDEDEDEEYRVILEQSELKKIAENLRLKAIEEAKILAEKKLEEEARLKAIEEKKAEEKRLADEVKMVPIRKQFKREEIDPYIREVGIEGRINLDNIDIENKSQARNILKKMLVKLLLYKKIGETAKHFKIDIKKWLDMNETLGIKDEYEYIEFSRSGFMRGPAYGVIYTIKKPTKEIREMEKYKEDMKVQLRISSSFFEDNFFLQTLDKMGEDGRLKTAEEKIGSGLEINTYSNPKIVQSKAKKYLGKDTLIQLSNKKDKKYMVYDPNTEKMIHFGQNGYEDFTKHKDENRRQRYLNRATKIKGNWKDNKYSPNNLSIHLLW